MAKFQSIDELMKELEPLMHDTSIVPELQYKLFSLMSRDGYRLYGRNTQDATGEDIINWYVSVTSWLNRTVPKSKWLQTWAMKLGFGEYLLIMREMAEYGTFLHAKIAEFLREGHLGYRGETKDMGSGKMLHPKRVKEIIDEWMLYRGSDPVAPIDPYYSYCESSKYRSSWASVFPSDMLAFAKFALECKLKPYFIEMQMASDNLKIAGALDFGGEAQLKGMDKPEFGLIDFKSSHVGLYETMCMQLMGYQDLFQENYPAATYPDLEVKFLANWRPTLWRKQINYECKNWTTSRDFKRLRGYTNNKYNDLEYTCELSPYKVLEITGDLELGVDPETIYIKK